MSLPVDVAAAGEQPDAGRESILDAGIPADCDRFALVAFAPPAVRHVIAHIHSICPPCGLPTLPAHVTVKGSWTMPFDYDMVVERIRKICGVTAPLVMHCVRLVASYERRHSSMLSLVNNSGELIGFHDQLWAALSPLVPTDYGREAEGEFVPHLTLVQAIEHHQVPAATEAILPLETSFAFTAESVALVGRAHGTTWKLLMDFPLYGQPSPQA
jgi:hypothetical protein